MAEVAVVVVVEVCLNTFSCLLWDFLFCFCKGAGGARKVNVEPHRHPGLFINSFDKCFPINFSFSQEYSLLEAKMMICY